MTLKELAEHEGAEDLTILGSYDSTGESHDNGDDYSFAGYAILAQVDNETFQVRVRRAVLAADVGVIINPLAHRGQLEGGFAFGLGNALLEELSLEDGRVTTSHLGDYKLPTQMDIPALEVVLLQGGGGPGPSGTKMAGELSSSGVAPAVANAIADAAGVRVTTYPVTAERVWAAMREGGR
jgi:CO/xanthine dehydrogenase Mo-binding subunit